VARRLAAIVAADIVGYSRLMHDDEEETHRQFELAMSDIIRPSLARHGGRLVKSTGDGFLAEFASAVEAVRAALEFQSAIAVKAGETPLERRILFRVGVNVGDVIANEHDIYGDHVNLAARLEQLADAGGILISGSVYEYVNRRLACRFEDVGERQVKNIATPVRIFRVLTADAVPEAAQPAISTEPGKSLEFSLFGPFALRLDNKAIPITNAKARAVLGCLALDELHSEARDRLTALLWSESNQLQARAALRQTIRKLRQQLGQAGYRGLAITPSEIWLAPDSIAVDAVAVLAQAECGSVHPLLLQRQRLTDDLLRGLENLDPAFRGWLIAKRDSIRDRLLRAMEQQLATAALDTSAKAKIARAIVNLDPTHEEATRQLVQERIARGDTAGAMRVYQDLQKLLRTDYGVEPSAATRAVITAIKAGASLPAAARPAPVSFAPSHSPTQALTQLAISVRPMTTHGVDPDRVHLVTGFRQHVIASLIRFRELQITDAPGKGSTVHIAPAAGRYELLMDANQTAAALNLMLVLKELGGRRYIWSDEFELNLENWFASQRRVVQRIAMALNVHLSADRLRRFSQYPDVSLGMHDRWLRCQTLIRTFDLQHWDYAAAQFQEIIEACPHFVPAYCGLADLRSAEHIARPGIFRSREREQEALRLARQAMQLDPADMRVHRTLAWAHAMAKRYAQAVMHIETACELNPNDSWTHISAALLLAFCGEMAVAVELARDALDMTLAPSRTHWAYQTDIEFLRGDYQAALEASERAQDVLWGVAGWRAAALAHLGRVAEAEAELTKFIARVRSNWCGDWPVTDAAIMRWQLHLYPVSRRDDWERLRDGLRLAGAPVEGLDHHDW
jgi:class 3 adenylate cyclase/DNA-binding SARP family transcriptional activator